MNRFALSSAAALLIVAAGACSTERAASTETTTTTTTAVAAPAGGVVFSTKPATSTLHVVHVGDTEAGMLGDVGTGSGGVARAAAIVRALVEKSGNAIVVHAGDTMIPAPELSLDLKWPSSSPKGRSPLLTANDALGLHAAAVGNHDFDLGEGFFADVVKKANFTFVTSTMGFDGSPLASLVVDGTPWLDTAASRGHIARRAKACLGSIVDDRCDGGVVGVVGASPEALRALSAGAKTVTVPADVDATRAKIQEQVDALRAEGLAVIVLLSHRQGVHNDAALVDSGLVGVDVIVSGGGENRMADSGDRLLPGAVVDPRCAAEALGCYPLWRSASDGAPVAVVATDGGLTTVGALHISFDDDGVATGADASSRPWAVDEATLLELRAEVDKDLLGLELATRDALAPLSTVVGVVDVYLDGTRELIREQETNLGSLSADAILASAQKSATDVIAAFRNGGGIRASIGHVGKDGRRSGKEITLLDVKSALRFDSPIVVDDVTHAQLAAAMDNAIAAA
ncbi:MAG TPA: 5'-nucleotidase C-terminal domain-containing protein, partial [Myxococcota bacterium]